MKVLILTLGLFGMLLGGSAQAIVDFRDGGIHDITYAIYWQPVRVDWEAPGMQTTLNLLEGGSISVFPDQGAALSALNDSRVNIAGGSVGNFFFACQNSQVTMTSGTVYYLYASGDTRIKIDGGWVGGYSLATDNSQVIITGGGIYYLSTGGNSQVTMTGGSVQWGLDADGDSHINIGGGWIERSLSAWGNTQVTMSAGSVNWLNAYGNSQVTMTGGLVTVYLYGCGDSRINIDGGSVNSLSIVHDSQVTMTGGSVGSLRAFHNSQVNWSGGTVGYIWLEDQSVVTIEGSDFAIDGTPFVSGDITRLSDTLPWEDPPRRLTGILANGDIIDIDFYIRYDARIVLTGSGHPPANQPPNCEIELQKNGIVIDKINVGEFFDIFVGYSTDDWGITAVRFSSDDLQDGIPTGIWTDWYEWDTSSGDWNAANKTKAWSFATGGQKEVWAEVKDFGGLVDKAFANILAVWKPFTFVHMTDVHIGWEEWEWQFPFLMRVDARTHLICAIREINAKNPRPDFILVTGDIVDYAWVDVGKYWAGPIIPPQPTDFHREYLEILDRYLDPGIKVYNVPGNHDRVDQTLSVSVSLEPYEEVVNPARPGNCEDLLPPNDYFFPHKGFVFVGLDSGEGAPTGTGLTNTQKDKLSGLDPFVPKVISMHHPAVHTDNLWVIGNREIREWFVNDYCPQNKVQLVLSGHTHEAHEFERNGVLFIQTASVGKNDSGFESGYRMVHVENGSVLPGPYQPINLAGRLEISLCSPGNLHVYDSSGRHTGLGNSGQAEFDIPDSFYLDRCIVEDDGRTVDLLPEKIVVFKPQDTYIYQVVGEVQGNYGLEIVLVGDDEEIMIFEAKDITTASRAVHDYYIDWDALSQGEEGVTVEIDSDGDGVFEKTVIADNDLTYGEFALQTETVIDFDPDTLNLKGEGKFLTAYIELPQGFDASDINVGRTFLEGLLEVQHSDVQDGVLMVKFDRQDVIAYIEVVLGIFPPEDVTLTVMGELTDETRFEGSNTIRVIDKGGKKSK